MDHGGSSRGEAAWQHVTVRYHVKRTHFQPLLIQTPLQDTHYFSRSCTPHRIACRCSPDFMHSLLPLSARHQPPEVKPPALGEETSTLLIRVLVVDALSSLAWIGGVVDGAWLPVRVLRKLTLKAESMVDSGEAEFDIVTLIMVLAIITVCRVCQTYSSCSLALFDAVYLALRCALASSKLHEDHVRPIRFGVESAYTSRDIPICTITHHIIDRRRA
jgi:hypothetical protein